MKEIILSTGEVALVDDDDYEKVIAYKWYRHPQGYAKTHIQSTTKGVYPKLMMHHLIMPTEKELMIDHINLNKLDNRKENLRMVTMSQNKANCPVRSNNKSGYKGVSYYKRRNKYIAAIKVNYKKIFLGYFTDVVDAAKAYNEAAKKYFGEYAYLNKV